MLRIARIFVDVESSDDSVVVENSEDSVGVENSEDLKNFENSEDFVDVENSEELVDVENSKDHILSLVKDKSKISASLPGERDCPVRPSLVISGVVHYN